MGDNFEQLGAQLKKDLEEKQAQHKTVMDSQQFKDGLKYLSDFSLDAINTIRTMRLYSFRASYIYEEFLSIKSSDDLLQSIVGIRELVVNGIHNMAKRELRYLLEMTTKYLVVDLEKMGSPLADKTAYLQSDIPNASIEVVDRITTPFDPALDKQFKDEVKDIFYKACAYVHPSKKQLDEQLARYEKGATIGFETAKMLADLNQATFRVYDIILTMLFIGYGPSMSGDLFIEWFDEQPKWKFHKGKYVRVYSKLFDYKSNQKDNRRERLNPPHLLVACL